MRPQLLHDLPERVVESHCHIACINPLLVFEMALLASLTMEQVLASIRGVVAESNVALRDSIKDHFKEIHHDEVKTDLRKQFVEAEF